jgi:hypothetical protein
VSESAITRCQLNKHRSTSLSRINRSKTEKTQEHDEGLKVPQTLTVSEFVQNHHKFTNSWPNTRKSTPVSQNQNQKLANHQKHFRIQQALSDYRRNHHH